MDYAIVDTGTSLMYVIPKDFTVLKQALMSIAPDFQCSSTYCYTNQNLCDHYYDSLSDLKINLGQMVLTIPPQGYLLSDTMNYQCLMAIANGGSDTSPYVLGDSFIRNFYTTFDFKKKTISFAKSSNAPDGVAVSIQLTTWSIIGISAGALLLIAFSYYVVKKCRESRRQKAGSFGGKGVLIGASKSDVAKTESDNYHEYNSLKGDEIVYSTEN